MIDYDNICEDNIIGNIYNINILYLLQKRKLSDNILNKLIKYTSLKNILKTQKHLSINSINKLLNSEFLTTEESYITLEEALKYKNY